MKDGKHVVLMVEDSEIVREVVTLQLSAAGFEVRTACGPEDLERKIGEDPQLISGVDIMVLDMELEEEITRTREDKEGAHTGSQMMGSQLGACLPMIQPKLSEVPFVIYSAMAENERKAYIEELEELAGIDEQLKANYRGFISKDDGAQKLVEAVRKALS